MVLTPSVDLSIAAEDGAEVGAARCRHGLERLFRLLLLLLLLVLQAFILRILPRRRRPRGGGRVADLDAPAGHAHGAQGLGAAERAQAFPPPLHGGHHPRHPAVPTGHFEHEAKGSAPAPLVDRPALRQHHVPAPVGCDEGGHWRRVVGVGPCSCHRSRDRLRRRIRASGRARRGGHFLLHLRVQRANAREFHRLRHGRRLVRVAAHPAQEACAPCPHRGGRSGMLLRLLRTLRTARGGGRGGRRIRSGCCCCGSVGGC